MKTSDNYSKKQRAMILSGATLLPLVSFGANAPKSHFSNPLFNTLLVVILLLAVVVISLGGALKSLIGSDFFIEKLKKHKEDPVKKTFLFLILLGSTFSLDAMGTEAQHAPDIVATIGGLDYPTFYTMMGTIAAEALVLGIIIRTLKTIAGSPQYKKVLPVKRRKPVLDQINNTVPIEEEESITLDHVYDGIRELDNDLPPWWKYGFYLTILVGVVYLVAYHVTGSLPLQGEEYKTSVRKGEEQVAAYMKNSTNNVDETTVKLLTEKSDLDAGKEIFVATCSACHGRGGEGGVGPNLTDDYWLHQGGVSDIFKTIKYGWPDKGMKPWKDDFSPIQIAQMTSFIKTLRGTNPPNAKEKQGDIFTEAPALISDTVAIKDSTQKLTSALLKK